MRGRSHPRHIPQQQAKPLRRVSLPLVESEYQLEGVLHGYKVDLLDSKVIKEVRGIDVRLYLNP